MVLDGASRTTALKKLGYPHAIVQVVSDLAEVDLHTWYHAIRQTNLAELVKQLDDLPEVSMVETSPQKVLDEMFELGGLCYLHTIENKVYLIQPAPGINLLTALNKLTNTYIEQYNVTRTLNANMDSLRQEFPDLTALVVFPEYKVEQVLQIAKVGHVLPAGITRFVIPGRVLRLNADLKAHGKAIDKLLALNQLVIDKQAGSKIRYYKEPVYLLDE